VRSTDSVGNVELPQRRRNFRQFAVR
jgi:hypothetical protein